MSKSDIFGVPMYFCCEAEVDKGPFLPELQKPPSFRN